MGWVGGWSEARPRPCPRAGTGQTGRPRPPRPSAAPGPVPPSPPPTAVRLAPLPHTESRAPCSDTHPEGADRSAHPPRGTAGVQAARSRLHGGRGPCPPHLPGPASGEGAGPQDAQPRASPPDSLARGCPPEGTPEVRRGGGGRGGLCIVPCSAKASEREV